MAEDQRFYMGKVEEEEHMEKGPQGKSRKNQTLHLV